HRPTPRRPYPEVHASLGHKLRADRQTPGKLNDVHGSSSQGGGVCGSSPFTDLLRIAWAPARIVHPGTAFARRCERHITWYMAFLMRMMMSRQRLHPGVVHPAFIVDQPAPSPKPATPPH